MVIGGEEINFYSFYEEGMTSGQVTVPELTGNPVDDAIFERNKFVESRLNVRIANDDDRISTPPPATSCWAFTAPPTPRSSNGTAAMATVRIFSMEGSAMRTMEDSYGVVPMPRLTEDQTTYRSTLHDGFSLVAIPTTVHGDHLEMVCAVLEAMGSASYRIVKPAYYETTLRTKLASDPDSARTT